MLFGMISAPRGSRRVSAADACPGRCVRSPVPALAAQSSRTRRNPAGRQNTVPTSTAGDTHAAPALDPPCGHNAGNTDPSAFLAGSRRERASRPRRFRVPRMPSARAPSASEFRLRDWPAAATVRPRGRACRPSAGDYTKVPDRLQVALHARVYEIAHFDMQLSKPARRTTLGIGLSGRLAGTGTSRARTAIVKAFGPRVPDSFLDSANDPRAKSSDGHAGIQCGADSRTDLR
jgi:hypothetical protein